MPKKRGRNASKNGDYNERSFIECLELAGYTKSLSETPGRMEYVNQSLISHPWGKKGRSDCMFRNKNGVLILVQNKNQNTPGSVDEKIPFQFDIARWNLWDVQFDEFWLVLGGTYWTTKAGEERVKAFIRKAAETDAQTGGRMVSRVLLQPSRVLSNLIKCKEVT